MKVFVLTCLLSALSLTASAVNLPTIGGDNAQSQAEEKRLGHAWLRQYRRQVPAFSDPLVIGYTENLLQRLSQYSELSDKNLSLILVNNRQLNAFAVPGGIIGIHTGLFRYAETEGQFASVLSHEMAHLSQRHYARGVEKQKGQQITNMAALLASLVLIATTDGSAGIAALSATQAGIIDQQLRFSRSFEEEADRLGMKTLIQAGYNADDMAQMFDQMLKASRFATQAPEFLLTHPVTAKRLADAKNRARSLSASQQTQSDLYGFVRARVLFSLSPSPQHALQRFKDELNGVSPSEAGSRYGLVIALTANKQYAEARENLAKLQAIHPNNPALLIAESEIAAGEEQLAQAIQLIADGRKQHPNDYALAIQHSRLLATQQSYGEASAILKQLSQQRDDPQVWYHLAELSGLAGDILSLHHARAEYYMLYGDFENARQQLNNLIKRFPEEKAAVKQAQQRLKEVDQLEKDSQF